MVPAVCAWHDHHGVAVAELRRRKEAGEEMVIAGHTIAEAYSVLTRLPAPYRLSAETARSLIATNFLHDRTVIALDATQYRGLLDRALQLGVSGGQIYDLVIVECAHKAGVQTLLTFNARHFNQAKEPTITIVVPGDALT